MYPLKKNRIKNPYSRICSPSILILFLFYSRIDFPELFHEFTSVYLKHYHRLFQRKLRSKECQNQGYVMDGYPKTLEQAQMLFSGERADELEEEVDEEAETEVVTTILPELVVSLEASDDFLKERIIQQPEKNIQNTHYTEEHMIRRLKEYR